MVSQGALADSAVRMSRIISSERGEGFKQIALGGRRYGVGRVGSLLGRASRLIVLVRAWNLAADGVNLVVPNVGRMSI